MTTTAPPDLDPLRHSAADVRRKAVIAVIIALSSAVLLFALGLALGRAWMAWGAVACLVAAALSLRRRIIPNCPRPSTGEVALAAATATYTISAVAFAWWGFYWLIGWALSLFETISSLSVNENRIAWIACLVMFGPVLVVAAARSAYEMEAELYPGTGLRSRYRDVIRFRGRKLAMRTAALIVGLAAFIVLANVLDIQRDTVGTWLLISFVLSGAAFAVPAGAQRLGSVRAPDVKQVADSAAAAGWTVLPNPQTGDVGIDPYLAEVDLFASKDSLSVLMKVVRGDPGTVADGKLDPVGWPVVATVLTASRVLPENQLPDGVKTVEPVVVLIDAELQSEPLLFASQNGVALLFVDGASAYALARDVPRLEEELQAIGERIRAQRQKPEVAP
jgi:hypothetical protein